MHTHEIVTVNHGEAIVEPRRMASWTHFIGFLGIIAATAALGFYGQHGTAGSTEAGTTGQLGDHSKALYVYLAAGVMDWALLYYCWVGVHRNGGNLSTLSGGRWISWTDLFADMAIALPFWILWEATAYAVHQILGPNTAKSLASLLPQSAIEILIWIAVSITAGICEEIAFRGYLQWQLHALGGSLVAAVVAQALIFGMAHAYQGWKQIIVISVLGILYGALAAWRRNLRANIIAHAWSDIWSGWLQTAI